MNTVATIRAEKDARPDHFCPHCLWRVVGPDGLRKPCPKHMLSDVLVRHERSLSLFSPVSATADAWLRENTDGKWFGRSLIVEHGYIGDLVDGLHEAGFSISFTWDAV